MNNIYKFSRNWIIHFNSHPKMKKRIHFLISKIQINLQNGDAFYAPFPFILQISKRKDRTSDSSLSLEIKLRKKITHNPEIPSITVLTPRRNRHLYSIPLAEAKLCSAAEKWPCKGVQPCSQQGWWKPTWDSSSCRDRRNGTRQRGGEEGKREREREWHLGGGVKFIGTR